MQRKRHILQSSYLGSVKRGGQLFWATSESEILKFLENFIGPDTFARFRFVVFFLKIWPCDSEPKSSTECETFLNLNLPPSHPHDTCVASQQNTTGADPLEVDIKTLASSCNAATDLQAVCPYQDQISGYFGDNGQSLSRREGVVGCAWHS